MIGALKIRLISRDPLLKGRMVDRRVPSTPDHCWQMTRKLETELHCGSWGKVLFDDHPRRGMGKCES